MILPRLDPLFQNATSATGLIPKHLQSKSNATQGLRVAVRILRKSSIFTEVAEVAVQKGECRRDRALPKGSCEFPSIHPTGENHTKDWRADPRSLQRKQRNGRPLGRHSLRPSRRFSRARAYGQGSAPTPPAARRRLMSQTETVHRIRPFRITLRLSPEELDHITQQASITSLRPARFLRELGMGAHIRAARRLPDEVHRAVRSFSGNLNQLAHQANMGRVDPKEVEALRSEVHAILKALLD